MMPYLVGVMLSGVPLRHIAAIIGPLQQYNLNEKETDVAENFRLHVCHTLYGCVKFSKQKVFWLNINDKDIWY